MHRHDGGRLLTISPIPRVDVLGVGISAVDMEMTLSTISDWIKRRESNYVCVRDVHGVMESVRDPDLLRIHNQSGLTVPDGMPLVWCAHWAGARSVQRVSGVDMMLRLAELAAARGWTSFFYGGGVGVAEALVGRLQVDFPAFRSVGVHSPPFRELTPEEDEEIIRLVNEAKPDLVWVGLGTPKQERWMSSHISRLEAPVVLGVGAAFDINGGLIPRAPNWMQRSGLEWLYRLRTEPRRLWKRYLRNNPAFVAQILLHPPTLIE